MNTIRLLFISLLFSFGHVKAEANKHLTVHELQSQGYVLIRGPELQRIFKTESIEVTDIESGSIRVFVGDRSRTGKNDHVDTIKHARMDAMFDPELAARPAPLQNAHYKITGDAILASDGIREYRLSFYHKPGDRPGVSISDSKEKNAQINKIYAVRNVDAGKVYFQVRPLVE